MSYPLVVLLVNLLLRGVAVLKDLQDGGFILIVVGSFTKGLCVHHDRILVVAITSLWSSSLNSR
jgi:hypothetical protein